MIDDLVFRVPPQAAEAATNLDAMLDEANTYCGAGTHLLTLATPPDLVRFRKWYLGEFVGQLAGRPPIAWADHRS